MRMDRAEGPKGGVIILVQNAIQAVEITKGANGNAEIHGIRFALESRELTIYTCYCPPNKQLSLAVLFLVISTVLPKAGDMMKWTTRVKGWRTGR